MNPEIDLLLVFGSDAIDRFRRGVLSAMNNELAVSASSSSTEEDQKAYSRLTNCLSVELEFSGSQIKCSAGIDRSKLSADFLEKNSGLIDLVESNMEKKNAFFLETMVNDEMEMPDTIDRMQELIVPYLYTQVSNMFGGDAS